MVAETTLDSQRKASDDLNLDLAWRIGERNFERLVQAVARVSPRVIVEFGAGASSIRLSRAFKESQVLSIEHDLGYFLQAKQMQIRHNTKNLCIQQRRLKWQFHGLCIYESYKRTKLPTVVDAIIIDGPPYYTFMGREACLYQAYRKLRIGGVVILDDSDRAAETKYIENWLMCYPNSLRRVCQSDDQRLAVLVKERQVRRRIVTRHLIENYSHLASRIYNGPNVVRIRKLYASAKKYFRVSL